ncbi:MAG: carbohydrate-binding domain-containing protein [Prevotella sp.]|nr:carbohydrate-binding domain-containing protein [Prevotella sp.]
MKKTIISIFSLLLAIVAEAQTLNVTVGKYVTYQFPASEVDIMAFSSGTTMTIMGKAFTMSEITGIYLNDATVTENTVGVVYSNSSAAVTISGDLAQYLTPTVSGAHVSIVQSSDVAEEITYTLSGSSSDGEFYTTGYYKATIELDGLTLTNTTPVYSGAAIYVDNGKRIKVKPLDDTTSTLTDASSGSQKGCLYVKGHAEFAKSGTLNIVGNKKHGIKSGDYCSIKNATINVTSSAGDGINCTQYFLMESGTVSLSGISDDGIQCDIDDTDTGSTGETNDHEDEDTGNIYLEGGTLTINSTAVAAKGIKSEGDIKVSDGTINVTVSGNGEWDESDQETKAAACVSSDADIIISGGKLTLTATGSGGKGMKCDNKLTISGGTITVTTSGGLYYNTGNDDENTNYTDDTDNVDSSYYSSPKGIKAGLKTESGSSYTYSGNLTISGGSVSVTTSGYNAEGIESKNTLYITGGTVTVNSYDDGLNSAQQMYLQGGTVTVTAKNNDGIDSNANMYISGGTVISCGASGAECGLDVAEGCSLYITGGSVLAIGGSNNSVSSTSGSQCVLSTSGSVSANTTVTVKNGSTTLASFTVPSTYSSSGGSNHAPSFAPGGGGNSGPGGGGNSGSNVLTSCAGLTSGSSYTVTIGSSSTSCTASTTSSGM